MSELKALSVSFDQNASDEAPCVLDQRLMSQLKIASISYLVHVLIGIQNPKEYDSTPLFKGYTSKGVCLRPKCASLVWGGCFYCSTDHEKEAYTQRTEWWWRDIEGLSNELTILRTLSSWVNVLGTVAFTLRVTDIPVSETVAPSGSSLFFQEGGGPKLKS